MHFSLPFPYSETELKVYLKKAIKIISIILIPAIIVIFLFENYILLVFGKEHSNGGLSYLSFYRFQEYLFQ